MSDISGNIQNQHVVDFPFPTGNKGWIPSEDMDRTHHPGWMFFWVYAWCHLHAQKGSKVGSFLVFVSFELILGVGFL